MEKCMTKMLNRNVQPRLVLLLLSLAMLSACNLMPPTKKMPVVPPPPPALTEEQEVRALLAEVPRLTGLSPEEAKQEQQAVSLSLTRGTNEIVRLRLALLLSLGVGGRNDVRLQALLDDPESRTAVYDSPRQQLWSLLQRMNGERLRLQHEAQIHADARLRDSDARLREAQARADDLQKKLDALKSVERTLNKRSRRAEKEQP
jgi:hypothetical protein